MPCFSPLKGFRGRKPGASGRAPIVFHKEDSCGVEVVVPCGQCIGCRLERSRQWAVRLMHESSLHEQSVFLTLTYDEEHLPSDGSLNVKHWQDFAKRLRHHCGPFRFFHCGEYGEQFRRPHYHACVFGLDFDDKVLYSRSHNGEPLFRSDRLNSVWGKGLCVIGAVTFESAAYCARYILKKVTGPQAQDAYLIFDETTGEVPVDSSGNARCRVPEYVTMSRRPGIGSGWFQRFANDVYPSDEVIVRGHACRPPRYYDALYERNGGDLAAIKAERERKAEAHADNNTDDRLIVREAVQLAKMQFFSREVE